MPATATLGETFCTLCGMVGPRCITGDDVCVNCYGSLVTCCVDCSRLVSRAGHDHRYISPGYQRDGDDYCRACYIRRRRSSSPDRWSCTPMPVSIATYERMGSKRKFGVEIETSSCPSFQELYPRTPFGCKCDYSIGGLEFDSPILYGDEGLAEIEKFTQQADEREWTSGRDCGTHTHYDVRDESYEELCNIAYAYRVTQTVWQKLVSHRRWRNSYCHGVGWTCNDLRSCSDRSDNFSSMLSRLCTDRYDFVNLEAYLDHQTFEVRLLGGTLNSQTICNWVRTHCRFIDCVRNFDFSQSDRVLGSPGRAFNAIKDIVNDNRLASWLQRRAERFAPALVSDSA